MQKPINTVIDKIVGSKPVQLVFQKLKAVGGAVNGKVTGGLRNLWSVLSASGPQLTSRLSVRGTKHHLWVEIRGGRPVVIMASNPLPLRDQLVQMEKEASAFLSGPEKATVDKAQADAQQLVNAGIQAMLTYIQTRPRGANPTADEAWLRANTKAIRGTLAGLGQDTITKVNARIAPAVAILDQHVLPAKDLSAAVSSAGGIVAFLKTLAGGGKVQGIDKQAFSALWSRRTAGTFAHRERIISLFRAAMPGHHEWLPSDLIEEVVTRDLNAHQLGQASNWVEFQHKTRTLTQHVVFTKERTLAGKSVPQGHSGSIYLKKTNRAGNVTYKPETEGQEQFHDDLRSAFRSGTTHGAVVAEIKAVIHRSLWDGTGQFKHAIHPECVWRSRTGQYEELALNFGKVANTLAAQYAQIMGAIR